MISSETFNNFKYYSKVFIILLVVFLLLRFMLEIRPYEAILLAAIIAVSVLIIENIIFINNNASDPLNCNQCKVSVVNNDDTPKSSEHIKSTEPFIGNLGNHLNEFYNNVIGKVFVDKNDYGKVHMTNDPALVNALEKSKGEDFEYKCVKVPKNNTIDTNKNLVSLPAPQIVPAHLFDNHPENKQALNDIYNNGSKEHMGANNNIVEGFEQFMDDQAKKNVELVKKIPTSEITGNGINLQKMSAEYAPTLESSNEIGQLQEINMRSDTNVPLSLAKTETKPEMKVEVRPEIKAETKFEMKVETKPEMQNIYPNSETESKPNSESTSSEILSHSVNYVQYQQDGLQQEAAKESAKINQFRREIADQEAVAPWSKDGYKYYSDIFTRSVGAPPANEALTNELKYGDYNYVGPINKGMINKEYTFVSPSNWYPIPPHPPVCVTNKSCTTCPVQISNGKDYMQWAPWDEFDQARRFTGDMGINIDYVKNVLNNPNGF